MPTFGLPGGTRLLPVIAALLAEGLKIGLIVVLLWTVLVMVDDLVMPAFFGSFFATILLFSMAFFVREYK